MGMSEDLELENVAAVVHRSVAREAVLEDPTVPALNIPPGPCSPTLPGPLGHVETPAPGAVVNPTRPVDRWLSHSLTGPQGTPPRFCRPPHR